MTPQDFFAKYAAAAIATCKGTGLLVSVTLAQAALESAWGDSYLTRAGNNFGGIKSSKTWKGKTITLPTREEVGGKLITIQAAFRCYPTPEAYFADRVLLFRTLSRYKSLFVKDSYEAEAMLFTKTGYCTDTSYGAKLISIIRKHNLTRFDV
jgi:flagellum-specific peptidoglycan hydrolase FlgJ